MCLAGDRYVLKDGVDKETVKKVLELSEEEYHQIIRSGILNPHTQNFNNVMVYIIAFCDRLRIMSYDEMEYFFIKI